MVVEVAMCVVEVATPRSVELEAPATTRSLGVEIEMSILPVAMASGAAVAATTVITVVIEHEEAMIRWSATTVASDVPILA